MLYDNDLQFDTTLNLFCSVSFSSPNNSRTKVGQVFFSLLKDTETGAWRGQGQPAIGRQQCQALELSALLS